jgi:hypothetical protein
LPIDERIRAHDVHAPARDLGVGIDQCTASGEKIGFYTRATREPPTFSWWRINGASFAIVHVSEKANTRYNQILRLGLITEEKLFKEHYDVIMIGAGLGGLTAVALLANRGLDVLIIEQHTVPRAQDLRKSHSAVFLTVNVGFKLEAGRVAGMLNVFVGCFAFSNEVS